MLLTRLACAVAVMCLTAAIAGQNANPVVTAAAKAMGTDTLTSITYSGTARP
jgi:hypothetical protein